MTSSSTPSERPSATPDNLGVLVGTVRQAIVQQLEKRLSDRGLNLRFPQFVMLKRLALQGPMLAGELAVAVGLDRGAMTRQLDQLEARGLLRRCAKQGDRRACRIELTDAGRAEWRKAKGCHDHTLALAQRDLSDTERQQLCGLLGRVLTTLRAAPTAKA